jgi:hypothetical protein
MEEATERSLWLIFGSLAIVSGTSAVTPTLGASLGAVLLGNMFLARVWVPGLREVRQRRDKQQSERV